MKPITILRILLNKQGVKTMSNTTTYSYEVTETNANFVVNLFADGQPFTNETFTFDHKVFADMFGKDWVAVKNENQQ